MVRTVEAVVIGAHPVGLLQALAQSLARPMPAHIQIIRGNAESLRCSSRCLASKFDRSDELRILRPQRGNDGLEAAADDGLVLRLGLGSQLLGQRLAHMLPLDTAGAV